MRHLLRLLAAAALVLSTAAAHADLGDQLFKLLPKDGAPIDEFGYSVAISGVTAIVGARGDDDAGDRSGSAYLFDLATGAQLHKLTADDAAALDRFGHSVAISEDLAIVGAPFDDDVCPGEPDCKSGSAYLFDLATGAQLHKLTASDAAVGDLFGRSVAMSGEIAIVGAPSADNASINSGSAYLFDVTTGQELCELTASDAEADDKFGVSVFVNEGIAIVGAHGSDDACPTNPFCGSGSAYLFDISDPQVPIQLHKLLAADASAGDNFGLRVSISGGVAIVGAPWDDDAGDKSGSAYLFDVTTGQQLHKLTASDAAAEDRFGISVSISGATAIVGAERDDENGSFSGSAYLFDADTGQQLQQFTAEDTAMGDVFGRFVAISGDIAIVGAPFDNDAGIQSGSAYLFEASDPCADDDGDGKVTICHVPLGSPGNAHTITVSVNALPAHLAHGDSCGPCEEDDGLLLRADESEVCSADVNGDGAVGPSDLAILLGSWGPCEGCPADFNGDGVVNAFDLAQVLGAWGPCGG